MSKIVKPWPPRAPRLSTLYSDADALADIPARLSSNATQLYAHTLGRNVDDETPAISPRSPESGALGHDHSGGRYGGRPFFKSVYNAKEIGSLQVTAGANEETVGVTSFTAYIPGCDLDGGAYVKLTASCLLDVPAPTLFAGDEVRFEIVSARQGVRIPYVVIPPVAGRARTRSHCQQCSG